MGNDLEIIKQIEKQVGESLKQIKLKDMFKGTNGYVINKYNEIIGLNLYALKLSDISFLIDINQMDNGARYFICQLVLKNKIPAPTTLKKEINVEK